MALFFLVFDTGENLNCNTLLFIFIFIIISGELSIKGDFFFNFV